MIENCYRRFIINCSIIISIIYSHDVLILLWKSQKIIINIIIILYNINSNIFMNLCLIELRSESLFIGNDLSLHIYTYNILILN